MSIYALLNGTHPLAREMQKYMATPWCQCNDVYKACVECQPPVKQMKKQGIQAHGGDLFQHCQWSALYLTMWYKDSSYKELHNLLDEVIKSDFLNEIISLETDIKLEFIQLCGFMHDIGKGGDQIYDMYATGKYGRKLTDADHPAVCKKTLLKPGDRYNGLLKKTLAELLTMYTDKKKALAILALGAAMHWNFGKLNIPAEKGGWTPRQYLTAFKTEKREIEQTLKIKIVDSQHMLIKLCMAIGCSDVAASYNTELDSKMLTKEGLHIAKQTHLSNGAAWTNHKFNKNHKKYINAVMALLKSKSKSKSKTRKAKKTN